MHIFLLPEPCLLTSVFTATQQFFSNEGRAMRAHVIPELWWIWDLVCFLIIMTWLQSIITMDYFDFFLKEKTLFSTAQFTTSNTKCVGFPCQATLTLTASNWHVHHRLRAQSYKTAPLSPLETPIANPSGCLCFWTTRYQSEIPTNPSSGLIIC